MPTASEYQAAVSKSVTNMDRLDQIVNGDADTVVTTDNGTVPSIAKLLEDNTPSAASPVFVITGTTHTLSSENCNAILVFTNNSDITLTIPSDASLNAPNGCFVEILQKGDGNIIPTAGAGLQPLEVKENFSRSSAKHSVIGLRKRAANTWYFTGDMK
jgi:hypothetical protein